MSYPENPETIIIKNQFYPNGLNELQIYKYYMSVKKSIIPQVRNRNIMFFFATDTNKFVVQRKGKFLDEKNYEKVISGRTVSIHTEMGNAENYAVIDIDSDNLEMCKSAAVDVYEFVTNKMSIVNSAEIRYTGKESFHIRCNLKGEYNPDVIRTLFLKTLNNSELSNKYLVGFRRKSGAVNLDLSPNKVRGNSIILNSLSVWGLRCINVDPNKIMKFRREEAKI